ncbi:hypothetical protein CA54_36290 [Symmachiella macrocystis]|uniref:Beta-lactamase class A catalytic domain-containing protein n=1 Tax=Symmachiella macrocystis TaxID=2527985 RepID=A0A5C6BRC0_9PLAN|nr:serine hydrolase [Symmachiella macrocystis]TWU14760.1 hypothetical protein CA54_36290 [Symmachiella macrocystis]
MLLTVALLGASVLLSEPNSAATPPKDGDAKTVNDKALTQLPGSAGFVFTELTDKGPKPLFGLHEHEKFAIGSGFKLFILGTLAEEANGDQRQLANVMKLRPEWVGPPHSEMAEWPMGSPVTLNTFALKMISISDNTATDHLLHLLGRENIEKQMAAMGHKHAQWNRPLLSTREMTMLRDKKAGIPGKQYQKLDEAAKRKFLAKHDVGIPDYDALDFDTAAFDMAEWYATPMDMARALSWIKQHTDKDQAAHPLRAILTVVPKLPHDAKVWPYVGFKGGSEDQLIAGNWLLKNRNGRWYTFHVFWNSPQEKVDQAKMLEAITQLFGSIQSAIE